EKSGSMVNVTGRLQRLAPVVPLPGEAREDWVILRDLLQALDGGNGAGSSDEVFSLLAQEVSAFEGRTLAGISPLGEVLLETGETVPLLEREKERIAKGEIVG
ncbi:MAG TPA: molybdopterin-dependent oxidoreductase, partial [Verrucomicrobiales bacterium]|nr:molybdopterin-dependent oxidoreductase [Verrucomicrobiales bacterium]